MGRGGVVLGRTHRAEHAMPTSAGLPGQGPWSSCNLGEGVMHGPLLQKRVQPHTQSQQLPRVGGRLESGSMGLILCAPAHVLTLPTRPSVL